MKKFSFAFLGLLALLGVGFAPSLVLAAPSMTPVPSLQKLNPMLPITEQLGQQLQTLVTAPPVATDTADDTNQELPPTFGTRALNVVINITEILTGQTERFITDFAAWPQLSDWLTQQQNDPRLAARWQATGNDILYSVGIALLAMLAVEFALYPLRRVLRQRSPRSLTARLAIVLSLFGIRALPIIVFVATSIILLNQSETQKVPRFLMMNVVYAVALARIVLSCLRGVLSPRADGLRFIPATQGQAIYGFRWLRAFSILIISGYFCIEVARAVHVPDAVVVCFINICALAVVTMGIVVILQKRAFIAQLLRGNLSSAQPDLSWFDALRLWFARQWHRLAIAYLVIGYVIAAMGVQDGMVIMLRGTLVTLLVLAATRLALHAIDHMEARSKKGAMTLYPLVKGMILRILVVCLMFLGCLAAWGVDLMAVAVTPFGHRLLGAVFSVGVTSFILGLIYEVFSSSVDRHLATHAADGRVLNVNQRSRTLLPMLRNTLFVMFLAIVGVVMLSEAGINIGPLIAGAGVLGVAVGFGSQALVKDFLTGLFIVLENTIAVGDVIKIGDHSGVVEAMSMRTLRLRDTDGSLHILPFSEVTQITNLSKGFSHALFKVNVSHDADIDRAMQSIRSVGAVMQGEPDFRDSILDPVEILGVDSINDNSVTLLSRIRTLPGEQWNVKRRFLWLLKQQFDRDGVQLPNATTVVVRKTDDVVK